MDLLTALGAHFGVPLAYHAAKKPAVADQA
jgi:hypothetical protein